MRSHQIILNRFSESIKSDLRAHREGLLAQGFWAMLIYRFGHLQFETKSRVLRVAIRTSHLALHKLCEMLFGISIGVSSKIGNALSIEHFGGIVIHGNVIIGDNCKLRQGVTIGNRHEERPLEAPQLGNRIVVGAGAKILGKVYVGDDARIGANAVVLSNVPKGATMVGIPAKIKKRTPAFDFALISDANLKSSNVR